MAIRFINGSGFIENVIAWRQCWIGGRLGSGKTLLSVALARWLYVNGLVRGVFANFPIDPSFIPIRDCVSGSVVILDEGWAAADARNSAKKFEGYGAYARKLDAFWLTPSVFRVDKRMAQMSCRRTLDLWLLDLWLYEWRDVEGYAGKFLLHGYQECYDRYNHKFIPSDDGGIKEQLAREVKEYAGSARRIWVPSIRGDVDVQVFSNRSKG